MHQIAQSCSSDEESRAESRYASIRAYWRDDPPPSVGDGIALAEVFCRHAIRGAVFLQIAHDGLGATLRQVNVVLNSASAVALHHCRHQAAAEETEVSVRAAGVPALRTQIARQGRKSRRLDYWEYRPCFE